MTSKKILVVVAHPDDEVLGCGGTILKHVRNNDIVDFAILGEGVTSRFDQREDADRSLVEQLQEKAREVAEYLGVNELFLRELPDNRFDSVDLLDVVKIVENLLDESNPDVIYTHHAGDLNIDHQITQRAVLTAARPLPEQGIHKILGCEVPSSTEWSFQENNRFQPNYFVGIGPYIDKKIEAMERYKSEVEAFPHPRSGEALRARGRTRGSESGYEAAEAFEVIRILN